MINFAQLNHYIPPESAGLSDAWKRVLGRLGDYSQLVVRALNIRPTAVELLEQTARHVLVRIATSGGYVVLRIAPEVDLGAALAFGRAMAAAELPAARIIYHDLSRATLPFAYLLERYVCGVAVDRIEADHLVRAAARQAGRLLRRMHRISVAGWGRPGPLGRWPAQGWHVLLQQINATLAPPPTDAVLFGEAERGQIAALLTDPQLVCERPVLIHGDFGPRAVRCTIGSSVQIEALVDPGNWVGGDGMFDLAMGLDPLYPLPWREGLLEGYRSAGALRPAEEVRLERWRLLTCYWSACRHYAQAEPYEAARDAVLALLERTPSSS